MAWVIVGTMGAGALMSMHKEKQRADAAANLQKQSAQLRAAQVRYSPWTERTNFSDVQFGDSNADLIGSGLQGGIGGAMAGQGIAAAGKPSPTSGGMGPGQMHSGLDARYGSQASPWSFMGKKQNPYMVG